ncbi:Nucleotidylyl transferase [Wolfiporia cocos MD-104 SS10]|uniref:Nucleotidylyl transferase n=1 Tax=Wolfiporia cocos (strain MD-104) TaxID=742152 RepID=A0A2H3J6H4_WOLCO|nr:Nucleotidylyl transferase [Wolfiporia cocos MD-104 SS10]
MPAVPSSSSESVRRAALLASIYDLGRPPSYLSAAIETAARATTENLRIVLFSRLFDTPAEPEPLSRVQSAGKQPAERFDDVQRLLTSVYVQATKVAQDMGRVLMDIDVLLQGTQEPHSAELVQDAERVYHVTSDSSATLAPASVLDRSDIVHLRADIVSHGPSHSHTPPARTEQTRRFPVAALGGTFDHLHAGHKILLSMGAWIASEKLIVGITDDALLTKKAFKEVLETIDVRIARVRAFLELFKPSLQYDLVPISDVYGPTGWDDNIQALIVSKETLPGAHSIHERRKEKSLTALETFVIDVISATESSVDDKDAEVLKNTKMSSTFIRQWVIEQRSKQGGS